MSAFQCTKLASMKNPNSSGRPYGEPLAAGASVPGAAFQPHGLERPYLAVGGPTASRQPKSESGHPPRHRNRLTPTQRRSTRAQNSDARKIIVVYVSCLSFSADALSLLGGFLWGFEFQRNGSPTRLAGWHGLFTPRTGRRSRRSRIT